MVQSSISAIKFNSFTVKVHVIFYRCIFATLILSVAIDKMCPLFVIQRSACGLNKEITAQQQTKTATTKKNIHLGCMASTAAQNKFTCCTRKRVYVIMCISVVKGANMHQDHICSEIV